MRYEVAPDEPPAAPAKASDLRQEELPRIRGGTVTPLGHAQAPWHGRSREAAVEDTAAMSLARPAGVGCSRDLQYLQPHRVKRFFLVRSTSAWRGEQRKCILPTTWWATPRKQRLFDPLCPHPPETVQAETGICEALQTVSTSEPLTGTTEGVRGYQPPTNTHNPLSVLSCAFTLVI